MSIHKLKDNTKITIRKIKLSDAKEMNKTFNRAVKTKEGIHRLTPSSLKDSKEWLKGVLKKQKKGKAVQFVAYEGKTYAGSAGISIGDNREKHSGEFGILIDDKYRGKGLGKILMKLCLDWSKKKNLKFVHLYVYENNKIAQKLYKKSGFKTVATLKKWCLGHSGKMIDKIMMKRDL